MKLTQKLLVGAVASLFATVGMAKGTLVYCSEGSPAGFDSAQYTAGTDFDASSYNVFNGLVDFPRGESKAAPSLAESWDVSPDGLTTPSTFVKGSNSTRPNTLSQRATLMPMTWFGRLNVWQIKTSRLTRPIALLSRTTATWVLTPRLSPLRRSTTTR